MSFTVTAENPSGPTGSVGIVPDEDLYSTDDPAFLAESDAGSSTQSLSSSILNYQYENGRRYHAYREGDYVVVGRPTTVQMIDAGFKNVGEEVYKIRCA